MREIFARYVHTGTMYKVVEELQRRAVLAPRGGRLWSVSTIRDILTDETYIGTHTQHRTRIETTGKQATQFKRLLEGQSYLP